MLSNVGRIFLQFMCIFFYRRPPPVPEPVWQEPEQEPEAVAQEPEAVAGPSGLQSTFSG